MVEIPEYKHSYMLYLKWWVYFLCFYSNCVNSVEPNWCVIIASSVRQGPSWLGHQGTWNIACVVFKEFVYCIYLYILYSSFLKTNKIAARWREPAGILSGTSRGEEMLAVLSAARRTSKTALEKLLSLPHNADSVLFKVSWYSTSHLILLLN